MSHKIIKIDDFKKVHKGEGFDLEITDPTSKEYSLAYMDLVNARDPSDEKVIIQLYEGFTALYVVVAGEFKFTLYEKGNFEEQVLRNKEYVYLKGVSKYEIYGKGTLLLISIPAYNEKMYSHPIK